tara:strand:+ start:748 stop:1392 length:645 start_codon:yes stop_codon:yes gene_type:complete
MSRTALLLTYRTHAGKRDVYHQVFERIVRPRVEANPGIELLFRCNDDDDPGAIHLFELYAERAVLDEVENASWLADYNTAIEPILADPMEFTFASPVWTKETDPLAVDMTSDPPPLGLFVQYRTRGGGRGAIRAAWEERVKPHIEASDAIRFFFWCEGDDPDVLCLFELYQDRSVLDTAGATEWFQAYREVIDPHIAERTVSRTSAVWIKTPPS